MGHCSVVVIFLATFLTKVTLPPPMAFMLFVATTTTESWTCGAMAADAGIVTTDVIVGVVAAQNFGKLERNATDETDSSFDKACSNSNNSSNAATTTVTTGCRNRSKHRDNKLLSILNARRNVLTQQKRYNSSGKLNATSSLVPQLSTTTTTTVPVTFNASRFGMSRKLETVQNSNSNTNSNADKNSKEEMLQMEESIFSLYNLDKSHKRNTKDYVNIRRVSSSTTSRPPSTQRSRGKVKYVPEKSPYDSEMLQFARYGRKEPAVVDKRKAASNPLRSNRIEKLEILEVASSPRFSSTEKIKIWHNRANHLNRNLVSQSFPVRRFPYISTAMIRPTTVKTEKKSEKLTVTEEPWDALGFLDEGGEEKQVFLRSANRSELKLPGFAFNIPENATELVSEILPIVTDAPTTLRPSSTTTTTTTTTTTRAPPTTLRPRPSTAATTTTTTSTTTTERPTTRSTTRLTTKITTTVIPETTTVVSIKYTESPTSLYSLITTPSTTIFRTTTTQPTTTTTTTERITTTTTSTPSTTTTTETPTDAPDTEVPTPDTTTVQPIISSTFAPTVEQTYTSTFRTYTSPTLKSEIRLDPMSFNLTLLLLISISVVPLCAILVYVIRHIMDNHDFKDHFKIDGARHPISPVVRLEQADSISSINEPSDRRYDRGNFIFKSLLGEGNFGQVWKVETQQGVVAVKTEREKHGQGDLASEAEIMRKLGSHLNVVMLLEAYTDHEPFMIVMEYAMRGRLLSLLRAARGGRNSLPLMNTKPAVMPLSPKRLVNFALDIAKGMEYISSKRIVHCDLAARNVLLDHNGVCKICDFGMSVDLNEIEKKHKVPKETLSRWDVVTRTRHRWQQLRERRNHKRPVLPIRWMAPESLLYQIYSIKSDVWSFGIVLWEITTLGCTPYPDLSGREVIRNVPAGARPDIPPSCQSHVRELMAQSWSKEPGNRPSFTEARQILETDYKWDYDESSDASTYIDEP